MNLTDEELNLAICEWIGWTYSPYAPPEMKAVATACWFPPGYTGHREQQLPNYLSDDSPRRLLNEAEARLSDTEYLAFNARLNGAAERFRNYVSANARQRVIAILQTVKPEIFK